MKRGYSLTRRQKDIFVFLCEYLNEHGFSPTLAEVASRFGLSSVATVHKHLVELERRHVIRRKHNCSRHIEIVVDESTCPTCGAVAADQGR